MKFDVVNERPARRRAKTGYADALRQTLTSGQALRFPLDGEPYAVVRTRIGGDAYRTASRLGARACVTTNDERTAIYVWLEPIDSAASAPVSVAAVDPVATTQHELTTRD